MKNLAKYDEHIPNIGRLIEDQEYVAPLILSKYPVDSYSLCRNKMRNSLSEVYFGKTKDVVQELRTLESAAKQRQEQSLRRNLFEEMGKINKRTTGGS